MTRTNLPNQQGFIALIAVMVIGAAATAIAVSILLTGTDSQRAIYTTQLSAQARQLATSCVEESLQIINTNTTYTGTGTYTIGSYSCTYTVSNSGGNNRVIAVTATVQNTIRKLKVYATIGSSNINVTSWQEVADT